MDAFDRRDKLLPRVPQNIFCVSGARDAGTDELPQLPPDLPDNPGNIVLSIGSHEISHWFRCIHSMVQTFQKGKYCIELADF